jgi:4-carboxymuconolactone decarboxylase
VNEVLSGRVPDGLSDEETLICRLARAMAAGRTLSDEDYAAGLAGLGRERLAELTWLVGYYAALALSLAVFRPVLPASIASAHAAGTRDRDGEDLPEG